VGVLQRGEFVDLGGFHACSSTVSGGG